MKRSDISHKLHERTGIPQEKADLVVKTILSFISNALVKGQRVEFRNFGNFTIRNRKAHEGRNPRTGEKVNLPPRKTPHFKPGLDLQRRVRGY